MRRRILLVVTLVALSLWAPGARAAAQRQQIETVMAPLFVPIEISASLAALPDTERRALTHIVEAARVMDGIFLEQVWAGNPSLLLKLVTDETPRGQARLKFFLTNKGPWSRLEDNRAFIPGVPPKPEGANYYPPDATKAEVAAWLDGLEGAERTAARGFFTTIRRGPDGELMALPYSIEYEGALAIAAHHLREAARLTIQPSLARYLETRADAFASNDYYASDVAWMELDASIEPTIGPYEVYEDKWFNYKAAFEAFVTIRDDAETDQLTRFATHLQELEDNLPIDPAYRNPTLGTLAPIRVENVIFTAGDANSGVQTAAFNLPNDERVVREKGSKRVMLKNVQQAKFNSVLVPISSIALPVLERRDVSFDAFFTHILMHELMHGLGPHTITVEGRPTTVRQELRDTLQHHRGGEGGHLGAVGPALSDRSRRGRPVAQAGDRHDLPGLDVSVDPFWDQRGPWQRRGYPAQYIRRRGRRDRRLGRQVLGQPRADPCSRHRSHPAADDDPGPRGLR